MNVRVIDVARFSIGCAELVATRRVAGAELGHEPGDLDVSVARVLGIRQVAQALLSAFIGFRKLGAAADILHALSMVALAVLGHERYRRAGIWQAISASAFAVWGIAGIRRHQ